ncbi:hypothetical protein AAFN87_12520 [Solibacillus sp. CAU 1738]
MSPESKEAYELKELYKKWQESAKEKQNISVDPVFLKAIKMFKNWQVEILK